MVVTCSLIPSIKWIETPGSLIEGEVVIVRVQVSSVQKQVHQLHALLNPDEVIRAKKYYKEEDYYRFLIARISLRILLAKYTNQHPAKINFVLGANKKPLVVNVPGLHYNISHCKDWVLIAIADVEVGVDVEKVDPLFPFEDIITSSFSSQEQAFVTQNPASRRAFFQTWTRKEAFVKATGEGINADFSSVPALDGRHYLASSRSDSATSWTISSFEAAPDYVAAIARPTTSPSGGLCFCEADEALFSSFYSGQ
jgi:4'-phosphopantetheinyl transferase